MKGHRKRSLNDEEKKLWQHVLKGVKPFQVKSLVIKQGSSLNTSSRPEKEPHYLITKDAFSAKTPVKAFAKAHIKPHTHPASHLDQRLMLSLKRGRKAIEARLDLHGLYQEEALQTLVQFLKRAKAQNMSMVLVITGKGQSSFESSGVLKRMVPHWLRLGECRLLVSGFEQAHDKHGGAGALYVKIKR